MPLHIYPRQEAVITGMANRIAAICRSTLQKRDFCTIVLSGGSSPMALYQLLTSESYRHAIEWEKLFFFFGDERFVPADHNEYNGRMAKEILLDPLRIDAEHIFYIDTSHTPQEAAAEYERRLNVFFNNKPVCFDIVLLGLGNDAHTASLFPHTTVLDEKTAGVREVFLPSQHTFRITMTAPLINLAQHVLFLAFGTSKAPAAGHVLRGERNINEYPAQLIQPVSGEAEWFLDEAAAEILKK